MIKTLRILLPVFLYSASISLQAQKTYFQQKVDYAIDATLLPGEKAIKGTVAIEYHNLSPDTLDFIWFHIWPNAYSGDNTALSKQIENDKDLKKTVKKAGRGYIDSLLFTANGKPLVMEKHREHPDIVKVKLATPLFPGKACRIETPFYNKLPTYFSRSGESDGQFIATQWYPKPAVYDNEGWHEMPYLDMGEYYAEFGSYRVNLSVPGDMIVGASGILQNQEELAKYKTAGAANNSGNTKAINAISGFGTGSKTLTYLAENVHDFAWFAQPDFLVQYDTCQLASGRVIDVFSYYRKDSREHWIKSIEYLKAGVRFYSNALGEYPHPHVSAVEGPKNVNSGGMEYPMITLITVPQKDIEKQLEITIVHEVGHNWFQGVLGTNEREYPWFDEGLNTFFQFRYEALQGRNSVIGDRIPKEVKALPANQFFNVIMQALANYPFTYAVNTSSANFGNKQDYGVTAYLKAAIWLYLLESRMGQDAFIDGIKSYYETWKFRHPSPQDFKESMEKAAGYTLTDVFTLLDKPGPFKAP